MNKATPITQKAKSPVKFVELLAKKLIVDKLAKKASPSKQAESPLKDINNFRHDRRDYEKSKYKKRSL